VQEAIDLARPQLAVNQHCAGQEGRKVAEERTCSQALRLTRSND
jgi:hypothetical protein